VARGITRHQTDYPIVFYTYRKLLTPAGNCAVCGNTPEKIDEACSASGGFHAFTGMAGEASIPDQHKAEARSLDLRPLTYDEYMFFIEADNLFLVDGAAQAFEV